jgi:hypothetical protein
MQQELLTAVLFIIHARISAGQPYNIRTVVKEAQTILELLEEIDGA